MHLVAVAISSLVALLHVWILVLESFWWSRAVKVFGVPRDRRDDPLLRSLFQNQGAYNGFLAVGLVWGLAHPDAGFGWQLQLFFLGCVAVAGVVGAVTAQVRILFVQTVPALLGIVFHVLAGAPS